MKQEQLWPKSPLMWAVSVHYAPDESQATDGLKTESAHCLSFPQPLRSSHMSPRTSRQTSGQMPPYSVESRATLNLWSVGGERTMVPSSPGTICTVPSLRRKVGTYSLAVCSKFSAWADCCVYRSTGPPEACCTDVIIGVRVPRIITSREEIVQIQCFLANDMVECYLHSFQVGSYAKIYWKMFVEASRLKTEPVLFPR